MYLICSGVAVSCDTKYHTPAIVQVLIYTTENVKIATLATVVRLCADHFKGGNSPSSKYVMKELMVSFFCEDL